MRFNRIDMDQWVRREHYQYYTENILTSYQVNIMLDVTKLKKRCRKKEVRFYPAMIYAIMKGINQNDNFRMAVDAEGQLGVYDVCHPSYTIFHEDDETFSDIWTEWQEDFPAFYHAAVEDMETFQNVKGVKAKPDKPAAFTPISCVPWISFTGVSHDTPGPRNMYFPIITFGKYYKENDRWLMPFSIYVNHAAADGYHTARLLNEIQEICNHCKKWIQ
jgi:chloramphenicol O-acetyltransferase type A